MKQQVTNERTVWNNVVTRKEVRQSHLEAGQPHIQPEDHHIEAGECYITDEPCARGFGEASFDESLFDESWKRHWQTNRLVLLVKEPTTIFAYWEVDEIRRKLISEHFQSDWSRLPFFLQLYDVTDILFDGSNAHSTRRIPVFPDSDNWYIHDVEPRRTYLLDFGTTTFHGNFFTILRSNVVTTPPEPTFRCPVSSVPASFVQFGPLRRSQPEPAQLYDGEGPAAQDSLRRGLSVEPKVPHAPKIPYADKFDGYGTTRQGRGDDSWTADN
jgi:hypothetical protein